MNELEPITLSGHAFPARHPWTQVQKTAHGRARTPEPVAPPRTGDLRLSVSLDSVILKVGEKRGGDNPVACRGVMAAAIFDSLVWRSFFLPSLLPDLEFTNLAELEALQEKLKNAAEKAAGKVAKSRPSEGSTFLQYAITK